MKTSSKIQQAFANEYGLIENQTQFVIWESKTNQKPIKYTPDFIVDNNEFNKYFETTGYKPTTWIEIKGFSIYRQADWPLRRKLIIEYCNLNNIEFKEYIPYNKLWYTKEQYVKMNRQRKLTKTLATKALLIKEED